MLTKTNKIIMTMLLLSIFVELNNEKNTVPINTAQRLLVALPIPAQSSGVFISNDKFTKAVVKNTEKKPADK